MSTRNFEDLVVKSKLSRFSVSVAWDSGTSSIKRDQKVHFMSIWFNAVDSGVNPESEGHWFKSHCTPGWAGLRDSTSLQGARLLPSQIHKYKWVINIGLKRVLCCHWLKFGPGATKRVIKKKKSMETSFLFHIFLYEFQENIHMTPKLVVKI